MLGIAPYDTIAKGSSKQNVCSVGPFVTLQGLTFQFDISGNSTYEKTVGDAFLRLRTGFVTSVSSRG